MNFLTCILTVAAMLSAPSDSIKPYYQELARKLAINQASVPTGGNQFEIIRSGKRYAELLYSDIDSADSLIEVEVYLFAEDKDGNHVRDLLVDKVAQGVPVRYIHDNFGNFFDNMFDGRPNFTGFVRNLKKSGIDKREHSSLLLPDYTYTSPSWRNHRKINLIDRKIAYLGGMNFTEGSISGWGDTQIRITGPAVQSIRDVFLSDWKRVGGRDSGSPDSGAGAGTANGKIMQVIADGPDMPAYMMEEAICWALANAKKYIWFETPYFLPSKPVMKALQQAAQRGLDVRVIVPSVSDLPAFDPAFRSVVEDCLRSGIKLIYRKPPFNHSKTFVCDDYITCVGSSNMDKMSLLSLYEINTLIYDTDTALEHKAYLIEAQEGARIADQDMVDSWDGSERFRQSLLGLFSHWL